MLDLVQPLILATLGAGTPLVLAATGELVSERSGVLNLGVEGMMLVGAAVGFAVAVTTGSSVIAVVAGTGAGMALALVFAFLTLTCMANQVATGLTLTILGIGISASIGAAYTGSALAVAEPFEQSWLNAVPLIGRFLVKIEPLTYISIGLAVAVSWLLSKSRAGLILRAVGDAPESANAIGFPVLAVRCLAIVFGGAAAGMAGTFLSVFYTPIWVENMTAGRGWIAVALVVFAGWQPMRVLLGAYLFGGVTILQFYVQGANLGIPTQFLSMLPYLATIVVLVIISSDKARLMLNTPASLGRPFRFEG